MTPGSITTSNIDNSSITVNKLASPLTGITIYEFGSNSSRTRNNATPAAIPSTVAQSFTSASGKIKITMQVPFRVSGETGHVGVFFSSSSSYNLILSTNNTVMCSYTRSATYNVTKGVAYTYQPYFASQSGSSTIILGDYTAAQMIIEDVI